MSTLRFETIRVLIWGKTYPELSARHQETVCTGGVRADGSPIRLYPVPLRYMEGSQQYKLYDWVEIPVCRNEKDNRPESFKVQAEGIRIVDHLDTDRDQWAARAAVVMRDQSWQHEGMDALLERQRTTRHSMGIVTPGQIDDVQLRRRSPAEIASFAAKWAQITAQPDIFRPEYKTLDCPEYDVRLLWRCADRCVTCRQKPHDMGVLDWGLVQLGRRSGWHTARDRLSSIADLATIDFRLFLGNFFLHQANFGIIGLWYPKRSLQASLPLT